MAAQRTSFDKLQRDRAKKAKAAAKRDRRQNGLPEGADAVAEPEGDGPVVNNYPPNLTAAEVLERIQDVHQRFDAGTMSYEDFEEHKAELLGRLTVE